MRRLPSFGAKLNLHEFTLPYPGVCTWSGRRRRGRNPAAGHNDIMPHEALQTNTRTFSGLNFKILFLTGRFFGAAFHWKLRLRQALKKVTVSWHWTKLHQPGRVSLQNTKASCGLPLACPWKEYIFFTSTKGCHTAIYIEFIKSTANRRTVARANSRTTVTTAQTGLLHELRVVFGFWPVKFMVQRYFHFLCVSLQAQPMREKHWAPSKSVTARNGAMPQEAVKRRAQLPEKKIARRTKQGRANVSPTSKRNQNPIESLNFWLSQSASALQNNWHWPSKVPKTHALSMPPSISQQIISNFKQLGFQTSLWANLFKGYNSSHITTKILHRVCVAYIINIMLVCKYLAANGISARFSARVQGLNRQSRRFLTQATVLLKEAPWKPWATSDCASIRDLRS